MTEPEHLLSIDLARNTKIEIFDGCGYVQYCYHGGMEEDIIRAARMSTSKGFQGWETDFKLLTYLKTHKHNTPFEFVNIVFEIGAPIYVARQVFRHRTFSYNEESGRYVELRNGAYIPKLRLQDTKNKQGSLGIFDPEDPKTKELETDIKNHYQYTRMVYEKLLREGVSKEVARMILPVSTITRWRMSGNLRNWLQYLELRLEGHAQQETREMSFEIFKFLSVLFPKTMELFLADIDLTKYPELNALGLHNPG